MMLQVQTNRHSWILFPWILALLFVVACGASATLMPELAQLPASPAASTRASITMVAGEEPASLGALDPGCAGSPEVAPCADYASDPFTYISGKDLEVVPLSGVDRWEQIAPERWRFFLRPKVKFHNGEPWNAPAAKLGIDWIGDPANAHVGY